MQEDIQVPLSVSQSTCKGIAQNEVIGLPWQPGAVTMSAVALEFTWWRLQCVFLILGHSNNVCNRQT